jgi:uncharacterized RDD family membrane protein YckC
LDASPSPRDWAPAGLRRRLASLLYETLLLVALLLVAGFLLLPFVSPARPGNAELQALPMPKRVLSFAWCAGVGAVYFGWFWTRGRRTLAMKTWRLKLADRSGGDLDTKRALGRYLAGWIGPLCAFATYAIFGRWSLLALGLNFLWALVDPERLFLHDRIAGTRLLTSAIRGTKQDRI